MIELTLIDLNASTAFRFVVDITSIMKITKKKQDFTRLKRPFNGSNTIFHNYAESDQDIFVLSMLDGLRNGTYLEIGAGWPEHISNTALLERNFGWSGISIDNLDGQKPQWERASRKLTSVDALNVNFNELLSGMPKVIDYLSVDCDPGSVSLQILKRIPFDQYQFRIITFEHECYVEGPEVKNASREFLISQGYQLAVSNVSQTGTAIDYEDWYVHPNLVDQKRFNMHQEIDDTVKNYQEYLYR
jgi:hypothetical protein